MSTGITNDVRVNGNQSTTATSGSSTAIGNALSMGNVGSASNSSLTESSSSQDKQNQAQIQELKNKINALCSKIGKTSGEVFNILGKNVINEENISIKECQKRLEALNAAIKDATINGQLDKEKAAELAKNYAIALSTGWTIEGLKNQNKKYGETTLQQRLISTGCLTKKSNGEYTIKELEDAVELYFNKFFNVQASKAKTDEERQRIAKLQIQTFGRLLINTKGKDREVFANVIANLMHENRLEGTKAVLLSMMTPKQQQAVAGKMHDTIDKLARGMKSDQVVLLEATLVSNMSAEDASNQPQIVDERWQKFNEKYSEDEIDYARKWYQTPNHSIDDVIEAYKDVCEEYALLMDITTGGQIGIYNNASLSDEQRINVSRDLDSRLRKHGPETYNAVQTRMAEFVDSHPEIINMSKDDFVAFMDKVSDGQFSTIVKESGIEQNLVKSDASSSSGVGLEQKTTQENYFTVAAAVDEKIQQLYSEQSEPRVPFRVEKDNDNKENIFVSAYQRFGSVKNLNATELCEGIAKKFIKFSEALDKYNELTQSAKDFINKFIESMSTGVQNYLLNGLKDTVVLTIAKHTNIDLSKINLQNLTFDGRQQLNMIMQEKQKVQSVS